MDILREIRQWIPGEANYENKRKTWISPNREVFISLGGNIYDIHLQIGAFEVLWEHDHSWRKK